MSTKKKTTKKSPKKSPSGKPFTVEIKSKGKHIPIKVTHIYKLVSKSSTKKNRYAIKGVSSEGKSYTRFVSEDDAHFIHGATDVAITSKTMKTSVRKAVKKVVKKKSTKKAGTKKTKKSGTKKVKKSETKKVKKSSTKKRVSPLKKTASPCSYRGYKLSQLRKIAESYHKVGKLDKYSPRLTKPKLIKVMKAADIKVSPIH